MSILCPPVILQYRLYFSATLAITASFLGVISQPGTRGTTEKVPLRWIFARNLSLVSWRPFRPGSRICLLNREARIEAIAGLQTSHPREPGVPHSAMVASNDSSFLTITI